MINVSDRQIVYPGQLVGENISCEGSCIREGDKAVSLVKAMARVGKDRVSLIPLNGAYVPKAGDVVLGVVDQDLGSVYFVDIDGPYVCVLRVPKDSGQSGRRGRSSGGRHRPHPPEKLSVGDLISAKIAYVDEVKEAQLIGPRKLDTGLVLRVEPQKVPRIIGKKKSMINLIRDGTGSKILVGQNGLIWIKGGEVDLASETIRMVESQAHTSGLTDRTQKYLKSRSKKKVV